MIEVRPGERLIAGGAFATLLLLIAGHTILETARDALLLAKLPPRALGVVYLAVAALTLPASALSARFGARFGTGRAMVMTLVLAAVATFTFYVLPVSRGSAVALYVLSGLVGSVLVPQFWILMATQLTIAQGRRLMGPIAAAGVIGGVAGSAAAAAMLLVFPVRALLLLGATAFVLVALLVLLGPADTAAPSPAEPPQKVLTPAECARTEPFLLRIALLVVLSTSTVLAIDYLFKWTVAKSIPADALGPFFARYYMILNGASLIVQLLIGSALVKRIGVVAALAITPALLVVAGLGTFLFGGALAAMLAVKGVDGTLRHSLHRVTTELVYLPVPAKLRQNAKPFIDGPLARLAQAITAGTLLFFAETQMLSRRGLAIVLVLLGLTWFGAAATLRRHYLALLRRAIAADPHAQRSGPEPIDFANAELLVERLASRDPNEVVAAMKVLTRRGRHRLIPALVLYHDDERVLVHALETFADSNRSDWIPLAERLVTDARESVRGAAMRALARRGKIDVLERLADDGSPGVRGYVVIHLALRRGDGDILRDPRVAAQLALGAPHGGTCRLGFLDAVADAPPNERAVALLIELAREARERGEDRSAAWIASYARAAARQKDPRLIPSLIELLDRTEGREALRVALVEMGEAGLEAAWAALQDRRRDRHLRVHLPRTISRFGTKQAAEYLLECIETESDGLVRYKAIRGLGRLVADFRIRVDRARVERLAQRNLIEHLRLLGLFTALHPPPPYERTADPRRAAATGELLVGLLDDKLNQSLERAFRLLKIAHPREDIHQVHEAALSEDKRARANAGEFLDTLLTRHDQQPLRALLRIVTDDLDASTRIERATPYLLQPPPRTRAEALLALVEEHDVTVASFASVHALALGDAPLRQAAARAASSRAEIDKKAAVLFHIPFETEAARA